MIKELEKVTQKIHILNYCYILLFDTLVVNTFSYKLKLQTKANHAEFYKVLRIIHLKLEISLETNLLSILFSASRDLHFDERMICFLMVVEWVALILRFLFGMWHYKSTLDFAFLF